MSAEELTIEEKFDIILKEIQPFIQAKKEKLYQAVPQLDEYRELHKFRFLDKVKITGWFYTGYEGLIGAIWEEFPKALDGEGNVHPVVPVTYHIVIKNHKEEEQNAIVDAKNVELI